MVMRERMPDQILFGYTISKHILWLFGRRIFPLRPRLFFVDPNEKVLRCVNWLE